MSARAALTDVLGGRDADGRGRDGEIAPHRAGRRSDRLPAGPRAPALDRHGDRPRRAHRARAALGDAARDRGGADRARRTGSCARSPNGAARRRDVHAARVEDRRADPLPRPRARARAVSGARARRSRADLFHLTVLHPAAHDERAGRGVRRPLAADEAWTLRRAARRRLRARASRAPPPTVRLSNARSEWGSCNAQGEIRLNWRLVQLPPALADYVVAHEVAHLVELNHSPRFWARGRDAAARPRGAAARARRLDGAARLTRASAACAGAGSARQRRPSIPPAPAGAARAPRASSSPERVSRQRPSLRRGSGSRRSAPRPRSRDSARGG